MTPIALERAVIATLPQTSRSAIRTAVRDMVAEGVLIYTSHFSISHLELNFNRPVRISDRIVLCPSHCSAPKFSNSVTVNIRSGASFGAGDHPTTRLALQGVDYVVAQLERKDRVKGVEALDIGTGSGVLAIAAVALGLRRALGVDIDPVARYEASENVKLNGMEKQITISDRPLISLPAQRFGLIMANLRPPTLKKLMPAIKRLTSPQGYWILSGCRPNEMEDLLTPESIAERRYVWKAQEHGWSAIIVQCVF